MSNELDNYRLYIHKSRYARYLDDKKRRENWEETVQRLMDFYSNKYPNYREEMNIGVKSKITNMQVMPSMRSLMAAGLALDRDNISAYNCSYVAVDHIKAFSEALYILMNGTGLGFSVERQYVSQLPVIADEFYTSESTLVVKDSKLGWAVAFHELVSLLYQGRIPKWDLTKLRPAGARLRTFGGRSSGPAPLNELFEFCVTAFKRAAGRKLTSIEAHDIMCKIGSVVVVGGVRRCLGPDTFVLVGPSEWKKITELSTDDKVFIGGEFQRIANVFDQGEQELLKIHLDNDTTIESTANHRWLVFNKLTNETEWVQTKDLQEHHGMIDPT